MFSFGTATYLSRDIIVCYCYRVQIDTRCIEKSLFHYLFELLTVLDAPAHIWVLALWTLCVHLPIGLVVEHFLNWSILSSFCNRMAKLLCQLNGIDRLPQVNIALFESDRWRDQWVALSLNPGVNRGKYWTDRAWLIVDECLGVVSTFIVVGNDWQPSILPLCLQTYLRFEHVAPTRESLNSERATNLLQCVGVCLPVVINPGRL